MNGKIWREYLKLWVCNKIFQQRNSYYQDEYENKYPYYTKVVFFSID